MAKPMIETAENISMEALEEPPRVLENAKDK
jgi:hypothetical protein